ncbi:hypothetical protein L6164_002258 [Bauhinia variegata]|uniref:Uncharacterized protein n=1 Tax=Bauhinia variegata TaxID=167791 RepID=A0ACB9PZG8_BAUVA|nr:hypothetical protein L6164_002258 [Bauhinia variegata]
MAEALLEVLLGNLNSLIQKEFGLFFGFKKEKKKLSSILTTICAVLEDAEEKQLSDRAIRDWLHKLKDAAHHLDDVLDEISTEALRLEYHNLKNGPSRKSMSSFLSSLHPKNVMFCRKIAEKMKDIRETLDEIAQERSNFHLSKLCASSLHQLQSLRTYMLIRYGYRVTAPELEKLRSLRALYFRGLKEVPSSINLLKHLRYLNLSEGAFKTLPKSICSLWNLQILNLDKCVNLQELPEKIRCLKALRHLHMRECNSLSGTSPEMGQLTCLITLNLYVASSKRGSLLAELKHLKLKGEIHIKHLERVKSVMDAKEANLAAKQLDGMLLSWDRDGTSELQENVEQILTALEPHPQLRYLWIKEYKGEYFPTWISSPTLKYLSYIELFHCENCLQLPALGKLPSLKELRIYKMNHVRFIDDESYDDGRTTRGFQSLQHLVITHFPNLERLSKEEGEGMFPSLSTLQIAKCPKFSFPHLPSVTDLVTDGDPYYCNSKYRMAPSSLQSSDDLSTKRVHLCSINKLHGIQRLSLSNDEELSSFPDKMLRDLNCLKILQIYKYSKLEALPADVVHLHALQELQIYGCHSLIYFTEQILQGLHSLQILKLIECGKLRRLSAGFQYLSSLKDLTIDSCSEIDDLVEALQHVPSLQSLTIASFPNLEPFPDWLESLTSLQSLIIHDCRRLVSLPTSIQCLTSLKLLVIDEYSELSKKCEEEVGEDWYKIAHVPNIKRVYSSPTRTYCIILINVYGRGELHIKHLEQVTSVLDAREAKLVAKQLDHLSWSRNGTSEMQESVEQILEALEIH